MKILVFTTQLHQVGGYERLAVELAIELNRLGVQADVLSQYTNDIPGVTQAEKKLFDSGVPSVMHLGLSIKPSIFAVLSAIYRFRKLVQTERYTAIEVSGFTPSLVAAAALTGMNIKVLVGVHDKYTNEIYGGLKFFLWKQLLRFSRHVSFFAISKSVASAWKKYSRVDAQRLKVIPNSINARYYAAACFRDKPRGLLSEIVDVDPRSKIVLFVGRLMKRKGIDTLYNALKAHLVSRDLYLVFVGRADDCDTVDDAKLLANMLDEIKIAPWRERVHFLGVRSDVAEIMAAADILAHPARIEGFGLVLAEALAVGLPVVASNVDGIPEVLADTDSVMVPPNDSDILASAILSVLEWPKEKLNTAAAKGKLRAESYRSEKRALAILELLKA